VIRLAIRLPAQPCRRGINLGWLSVPGLPMGADVLLLDDTWVSGGSAQSAAAALKLAGARTVALVVLGRHVDPADPRSAELLRALRSAA
jgi:adenine/guanine phosphoribosyltransferase-like PRPP-binding protein